MAQIECANCAHQWDLGSAATNRCPKCGWIAEIYYDLAEANRVKDLYNEQSAPGSTGNVADVRKLIDINGFSVSFPDEGRLAEVAKILLEQSSE
jgi:predicted  nucleic acid-binding Zn-ribbon protein